MVDELVGNSYYKSAWDVFIDEPLVGGEIIRFGNKQGRFYDLIVDELIVGDGTISEQIINLSSRMVELLTAVSPFQNFIPGGQPTVRTGAQIQNLSSTAFTLYMETYRSSISDNRLYINVYEKYWKILNEGTFTPNEDITENNTVIIPSGTTLYKYTLKDFDLSTGAGTTRTLWSKESEIRLRFLTRPNSTVNQRYIPSSIPAGGGSFDYYTLFSSLYMPINKINGLYIIPDTSLVTLDDSGKTLNLNLSLNNYFLAEGDKLTFILKQKEVYPSWNGFYKAQFNSNIQNKIRVNGDPNIRAIANDNIALLNPTLSLRQDPSNNNFTTLYLDSDLSSVYTPNTSSGDQIFYAPNIEGDISDIYSKYGDIDYAFHMNIGDSIILKDARNFTYEFGVKEVVYDSINECYGFKLLSTMDSTLFNELFFDTDNKRYFEILYLNKIKDETNVLAVFTKKDGRTSYGFIIPDNLHPDVLANIDTITKEVKQKLLADQQGTVIG